MTTENRLSLALPLLIGLGTVLGSWALACVFPFAAFAAFAALTLPRRTGLGLITAVWAANQLVGFFLLSFPWDAQAVGHGIAMLATSIAAFTVARAVAARSGGSNPVLRAGATLISAFVAYEALLWAYAQIGGGAENFTAEIITFVARNDALWFAGLMAVHFVLARRAKQALHAQQA